MIPTFPHFDRLTLKQKKTLSVFIRSFPPVSDFNFVSLWSYNIKEDVIISFLNKNLVVRFRDYLTGKPFYSFLGVNSPLHTIETLLSYSQKQGLSVRLKLLPEILFTAHPWLKKKFKVVEDISNHDYIFLVNDLSELKGEKYNRKHRLVNKFNRDYPQNNIVIIEPSNKKTREEIIKVFMRWEKIKGRNRKETENELAALKRLLLQAHHFPLLILGVYHKGLLEAFSITEIVHDHYAIGQFMKTNPAYRGITETVYYNTARLLKERHITFLNLEQDLGIEGLRQAKLHWHPVHFLKKYTISFK